MSDEMVDYKVYQLNFQLERLVNAVDKICDRIDVLEKESFEKSMYRKFISFLYTIYPLIMIILITFSNFDRHKIEEVLANNRDIISEISDALHASD